MTLNINKSLVFLCLFTALFSTASFSNATGKNSMSFESWVERLRDLAFAKGVSVDTLQNTFLRNRQLDLSAEPYKQTAPLATDSLQNNFIFSQLLLKQYSNTLFEISHLFGVDIEVLVAITSMQNKTIEYFPAIDILINRSFLHPKDLGLQNELLQALRIIDEGQIDLERLKSDSLGRLGKIQFKPTIFRKYAIDFDADGSYDLWQNYSDILASTANYLTSVGWQVGKNWGVEVALPEDFDLELININQQKNLGQWQALGIFQANGDEIPNTTELGSLVQLDDKKYYIVLDNYFALLRWNRSEEFTYSVARLIGLLKPQTFPANTPSDDDSNFSHDESNLKPVCDPRINAFC